MWTNCSTFPGYKNSNSLKIDSLNHNLLVHLFAFMVFNAISNANPYSTWEVWSNIGVIYEDHAYSHGCLKPTGLHVSL